MMDFAERWPGYTEQSWSERFAELDRRYTQVMEAAINIPALKSDRDDTIRECAAVVAGWNINRKDRVTEQGIESAIRALITAKSERDE